MAKNVLSGSLLLIVCLIAGSATASVPQDLVLLFNGRSRDDVAVRLLNLNFPPKFLIDYYLDFSFQECSNQGNLIHQVEASDMLSVEQIAEEGGKLCINVTTSGSEFSVKVGSDLTVGKCHKVELRFIEYNSTADLSVRLDEKQWTQVGQSSDSLASSQLFTRSTDDTRPSSLVLGGNRFGGCLLNGQSLVWKGLRDASSDAPISDHRLASTCPLFNDLCRTLQWGLRPDDGLNFCWTRPCQNGGICTDYAIHPHCDCIGDFYGEFCETEWTSNWCNLFPCSNGATCIDLVGGYRCQCESGWTGKNCDADIDECADSPCMNNATCAEQMPSLIQR